MFHPNPQSMPFYGRILSEILVNSEVEDTFVTSNTSKHTFILTPLNTSCSYTTIAFPIFCTPYENRSKMIDVSTQTELLCDVTSSLQFQRYAHHSSTYVESSHLSFQNPQYSSSFYSQLPPPYPFQKQIKDEAYRDRFDRRGRRNSRGTGSTSDNYGNLTLSMFINNDTFNQSSTTPRGRRPKSVKAGGRKVKVEPKEQSEQMSVENIPDEVPALINAEFSIIDEIITQDFMDK